VIGILSAAIELAPGADPTTQYESAAAWGALSQTLFAQFIDCAIDGNDTVYAVDSDSDKVIVFDSNGNAVTATWGPGGVGDDSTFAYGPSGIATDGSPVYVIDSDIPNPPNLSAATAIRGSMIRSHHSRRGRGIAW
jgi:YVTN family beta-propeller protein